MDRIQCRKEWLKGLAGVKPVQTAHASIPIQKGYVWNLTFFTLFRWIQLCDKKNLTFLDCCDQIFIELVLKNGSLNNIFQDFFNRILSEQLNHDRYFVCLYYIK